MFNLAGRKPFGVKDDFPGAETEKVKSGKSSVVRERAASAFIRILVTADR
jgi:hypothetical protein